MHYVLCVFIKFFVRPLGSHHTLTAGLPHSLFTQKHGMVMVGTQLSVYERSKNALQSFPSIPGLYLVNEGHISIIPHWYYSSAFFSMSLLSPYYVLIGSGPHYVSFGHVQNSPTSAKTIKIALCPLRFLLFLLRCTSMCCVGPILH